MNAEELTSKYIVTAEKVLEDMEQSNASITVDEKSATDLISYAKAYFEDAKYYKAQKKFETSLVSIAYCEGLLDALRLIGAVKFEWPTNAETKR